MKGTKSKHTPNIPFYDTKCRAYNPMYETQKRILGYSNDGPIYAEKQLLVSSYCSMHDTYDFDCKKCSIYKTKMRIQKEGENVNE